MTKRSKLQKRKGLQNYFQRQILNSKISSILKYSEGIETSYAHCTHLFDKRVLVIEKLPAPYDFTGLTGTQKILVDELLTFDNAELFVKNNPIFSMYCGYEHYKIESKDDLPNIQELEVVVGVEEKGHPYKNKAFLKYFKHEHKRSNKY
jgi:hypothetical protein